MLIYLQRKNGYRGSTVNTKLYFVFLIFSQLMLLYMQDLQLLLQQLWWAYVLYLQ